MLQIIGSSHSLINWDRFFILPICLSIYLSVITHSFQSPLVTLGSSCVAARGQQFVVCTRHVAANPGHLRTGIDRALLRLGLHL